MYMYVVFVYVCRAIFLWSNQHSLVCCVSIALNARQLATRNDLRRLFIVWDPSHIILILEPTFSELFNVFLQHKIIITRNLCKTQNQNALGRMNHLPNIFANNFSVKESLVSIQHWTYIKCHSHHMLYFIYVFSIPLSAYQRSHSTRDSH